MNPQRLLCDHLKKKAFVLAVFAVYLRSISLALLWKVDLQAKSYNCYACNEYLSFPTKIGALISTISYMRFVNTVVWAIAITYCICALLNRHGLISHLQLAYISNWFNKYTVVTTAFIAMRLLWNYNGIILVTQFIKFEGSTICSDIPVWMIQNLEKVAFSIIVFVLEFGVLIRAREISYEWKEHAKAVYARKQVAEI